MKKHLTLGLAFIVMLISSCQKNPNTGQVGGQDGMVDFSITTTLPQGPDAYTRTETNSKNSASGGLTNVDQTDYDLRYIMEVWTIGDSPKKVYRKVTTVADNWDSTPATFDVRLIAQKYNFVFWADFVTKQRIEITEKGLVDLHYNTTTTTGLNNIVFLGDYKVSDDTRDAYFHKEEIDLSVSTNKISVSLKRPFAKVRFIATDRPLNTNSTLVPASSTIEYPNATFYTAFNAITGAAIGTPSVRNTVDFLTAIPTVEPTVESTAEPATDTQKDYLLVFDYILPGASVASIGESNISTMIDGVKAIRPNLPAIPIVANTLVTLKGNLYSNRGVVTVNVTDAFDPTDNEVPVDDIIIEGEVVKQTVESVDNVNESIERLIKAAAAVVEGDPVIEVKVTKEVTSTDAVVSIPTVTIEKIAAITYDFSAGIATGQTLTIGETANTYAGTINVIVPETNVGSVIINAPKAHVNINGKYTDLTAATSATTLVIQAGAEIGTLTVTEGNVVIRGNVGTLVNTGSGTVIEYVTTADQLNTALGRSSEINLADGTYDMATTTTKQFHIEKDLKIIGATKGKVIIKDIELCIGVEDSTIKANLEVVNIAFENTITTAQATRRIINVGSHTSKVTANGCEFNMKGAGTSDTYTISTNSGNLDIDFCIFKNEETNTYPYAIYSTIRNKNIGTATMTINNTEFSTNSTFATEPSTGVYANGNSTAIFFHTFIEGQKIDYSINDCTFSNYAYSFRSHSSTKKFGVGSTMAINNVTMNSWYCLWTYGPNITFDITNSTFNAVNPHNGASSDSGNIHIQNAKTIMNFTNVKMSTKSTDDGGEPSRIYPFRIRMDKTQPDGNIVTLNFIGNGNTITESGNNSEADTWRPKYMIHEAGYRRMTDLVDFATLYPNVSNRITVTGTPTITGVEGATLRNEDIFGDDFILFNNVAYQTHLLGLTELDTDGDKKISVVEAANFKGAITRPAGAVELNAKRVENFFPNATMAK